MLKRSVIILSLLLGMGTISTPAIAQSNDVSPVLFLESGPSDNPEYRRMVFVKYLSGDQVRVAYKAYNRAEFAQVRNTTPHDDIRSCSSAGSGTNFSEIRAFERADARRARNGQPPEVTSFCIKNIRGWESEGNRKKYLDPIFNGMPYAANMK